MRGALKTVVLHACRCRGLLELALSSHRELAIPAMGALQAWLGGFRFLLADAPNQRKLLLDVLEEHKKLQSLDRGIKAKGLLIKGYAQLAGPIKAIFGEEKLVEVWESFSKLVQDALGASDSIEEPDDAGANMLIPDIAIAFGDMVLVIKVLCPLSMSRSAFSP